MQPAKKHHPDPWQQIGNRKQDIINQAASLKKAEQRIPIEVKRILNEAKDRDKHLENVTKSMTAKVSANNTTTSSSDDNSNPWSIAKTTKKPPTEPSSTSATTAPAPAAAAAALQPIIMQPPRNAKASNSSQPAKKEDKNAVEKKEDKKVVEKKDEKKNGGYLPRLEEQSYASLKSRFGSLYGKRVHESDAVDFMPQLVTRDNALKRHLSERRIQVQVSQIVELCDELWMFGRTNTTASVGIQIEGFHPFFFVNVGQVSPTVAHNLLTALNQRQHWPPAFVAAEQSRLDRIARRQEHRERQQQKELREQQQKNRGKPKQAKKKDGEEEEADDKEEAEEEEEEEEDDTEDGGNMPVVGVSLEYRRNAVVYSGSDKQPCLRIDFANMRALTHYRELFALRKIKLPWELLMYHEEQTLTQMYFNQTKVRLFDYVQVDPEKCHFLPSKAWDRLKEEIRRDDDRRDEALSLGEAEDRFAQKRGLTSFKHTPKTWCHLEGHCHWKHIESIEIEAAAPIPIFTFDIETVCGATVDFYRKFKITPEYNDDIDPPTPQNKPHNKQDTNHLNDAKDVKDVKANNQTDKSDPPQHKPHNKDAKADNQTDNQTDNKDDTSDVKVDGGKQDVKGAKADNQTDNQTDNKDDTSDVKVDDTCDVKVDDTCDVKVDGGKQDVKGAKADNQTDNKDDTCDVKVDGGKQDVKDVKDEGGWRGVLDRWCGAFDLKLPDVATHGVMELVSVHGGMDNALAYANLLPCENANHWMTVVAFPHDDHYETILYENIYSHHFQALTRHTDDEKDVKIRNLSKEEAVNLCSVAQATLDLLANQPPSEEQIEDAEEVNQPPPSEEQIEDAEEVNALPTGKRGPPGGADLMDDQDGKIESREAVRKRVEGRFPVPRKTGDKVALIATHVMILGDSDSFLKVIHCLGKPEFKDGDLKDTLVFTFNEDNERGMMEHWSMMLRHYDAEWLAGYNSISYDLPFIFQRCQSPLGALEVFRNLSRFQCLPHDRLRGGNSHLTRYKQCMPRERIFGSKGTNNEIGPQVEVAGLIQFDALKIVKLLVLNMNTYSLKEVAKELLKGEVQKKDLPPTLISPFFAAGGGFLRKLAIYNYYDVQVTVQVMIKRFLLGHAIEVARASWTSIMQQMLQGAQIKTWNLICKTAHRDGWLLDERARQTAQKLQGIDVDPLPKYLKKFVRNGSDSNDSRMSFKEQASLRGRQKKYDGAFVLPPIAGLYEVFVSTLDFASLYPSIMIAYNLCFSTWIEHRFDPVTNQIWFPYFEKSAKDRATGRYCVWRAEEARPDAKTVNGRVLILVATDEGSGQTDCFVQDVSSLLPGILKDLMALRKSVKKLLKAAEDAGDKFLESVLDSRQAAIKVLCNASYGFCGATAGFFGMLSIARTTTFMGRLKIMFTKHIVETVYGGRVIYGDTDSVFIIFPQLEVQLDKTREEILEEVKATSEKACKMISSMLPAPMALEFEKVFVRFLLLKKKQYAGIWIWPKDKFMMKGISAVRRDSCKLAQECVKETLKRVLTNPQDRPALLEPLQKALQQLEDPNIPLSLLEKTVAKKAFYKNNGDKLIQKHLFDKVKKQTGIEVEPGSRVGYIVTLPKGGRKRVRGKDEKIYLDGETTTECMDKGIPADRPYYVKKQLEQPILRYLALLDLEPKIKGMVQKTLDKIWVQDSKNTTIHSFFKRDKN